MATTKERAGTAAKVRKRDTGEIGNRGEFGSVTRGEADVAVAEPGAGPQLGENVGIDPGARIDESLAVGDVAVIGADVTIGPDVTIGEGVVVGDGSTIGAGTNIADGARLVDAVTVGGGVTVGEDGPSGQAPRSEAAWSLVKRSPSAPSPASAATCRSRRTPVSVRR